MLLLWLTKNIKWICQKWGFFKKIIGTDFDIQGRTNTATNHDCLLSYSTTTTDSKLDCTTRSAVAEWTHSHSSIHSGKAGTVLIDTDLTAGTCKAFPTLGLLLTRKHFQIQFLSTHIPVLTRITSPTRPIFTVRTGKERLRESALI